MKKQYISIFILIISMAFIACEKDETKMSISPETTAPSIAGFQDGFSKEISADNLEEVMVINWSEAGYGIQTEVNYTVEMDLNGNNFANANVLGSTSKQTISITLGALNDKIINVLGIEANTPASVQFRVIASINNNEQFNSVSELITMSITTWQEEEIIVVPEPEKLWMPGSYQEWTPAEALTIHQISEGVYEGYVYFPVSGAFKFTSHPNWDNADGIYGLKDGAFTTDGAAGGSTDAIGIDRAGYYLLKVDLNTMSFNMTLIESFGIIGPATPGGWDADTDMTYSTSTGLWTITTDLNADALKFRANDDWSVNYGPASSNALEGTLIFDDPGAISIPEAGNYTITIDMNKFDSPYQYSYSIVKN